MSHLVFKIVQNIINFRFKALYSLSHLGLMLLCYLIYLKYLHYLLTYLLTYLWHRMFFEKQVVTQPVKE